jgi:hypothetical protein
MTDRILSRSVAFAAASMAAVALMSACGRARPESVTLVGVPGQLNQHVSAASDGSTLVALAWAASSESTGTNIFAAVSSDAGNSFSAPVRVNAVEGQADVNGEQPPRVTIERSPDSGSSIVVLWTAKGREGTSLLYARSTDRGRTFGPTTSMPSVDAPGNRGWESMAAAGNGEVYALWLDHRDTAQAMSGHTHRHGADASAKTDGVARAQRSQLFVSSLNGRLAPRAITRGVCYCCKTALTIDDDGTIYAAWRHVYPANMRDIAFTRSRDGGNSFEEPVRISEDEWQLDGCPENGPALSVDASKRIHVLWPTLVRDGNHETLKLFHAFSSDGRTFSPRAALPTSGPAYHPQLVIAADGSLFAAWDEVQSGTRRVRVARGHSDGRGGFGFSAVSLGDDVAGSYPALAALEKQAILAWATRTDDESRIGVARIPY